MKRCSTLYITREMQFKTTVKYHYKLIRMADIQNIDNIKCWQECGPIETFTQCWWESKMVELFMMLGRIQ